MATTKTRKPQPEITAPAIFRCIDKASGKVLGYGVPSDSEPNTTYYVQWDASKHCYTCTCKGGQYASNKPCKHIRSVQSVLAAKKQLQAPRRLANFFQALATVAQQQVAAMAVQEAEQAVQPPQRYCEACSCVGKLQMVDGLHLCETCAEATRPVTIEPPPTVASHPTIATRGNAPLNTTRTVTLTR